MDAYVWLLFVGVIVWTGLGAYLAFLGARQRALALRLRQWEASRGK